MSEIDFKNDTEKSFVDFFKRNKRNIEKIETQNSPDFIVDGSYIFEVKAFNPSGTLQYSNGMTTQKINIINVLNKFIIDFNNKIINYKKINKDKKIDFFALVIYDLRYKLWNHTLTAFNKCKIAKYTNIDCLIYAGYYKKDNRTLALHTINNGKNIDNIIPTIFSNLNYKFYNVCPRLDKLL